MDLRAGPLRVPIPSPVRALAVACCCGWTVLFGGCGAPRTGLYDWGGYENSLYLRYSSQDFATAETEIYRMLPQAGTTGRVPPGVYADYGFLLYRRGDHGGAIAYFEKEKQAFPESTLLMNKLIERVRSKGAPAAGTETPAAAPAGPATRLEPAHPGSPSPGGAAPVAAPPAARGAQP